MTAAEDGFLVPVGSEFQALLEGVGYAFLLYLI